MPTRKAWLKVMDIVGGCEMVEWYWIFLFGWTVVFVVLLIGSLWGVSGLKAAKIK